MSDCVVDQSRTEPKLSICITTFNRGSVIGPTLDSILAQATDECELVVLDAASQDSTFQVLSDYARRFRNIRYTRQDANMGFDRDCDRVVELAKGEYCWLMTDDDLLKPGAVAAVLDCLREDLSLVILTTEIRDSTLTKVLHGRWPEFKSNRVYGPGEMDRLFVEVGGALNCNAYVIRREVWLARERVRYYGSWFSHIGVIFQEALPGDTIVLAEPYICYREGNNHTYSSRYGELIWVRLPSVIASLAVTEAARKQVYNAEPWRHWQLVLRRRAQGYYSMQEYREWVRPKLESAYERGTRLVIALLPGMLVNAVFVIYYSMTRRRHHGKWQAELILHQMRESPFYILKHRMFRKYA